MPSRPAIASWLTDRIRRGPDTGIWLLAAALGVAYSLYGIFRHRRFGSSGFDLGIFDQAVWHLSRFEAPASTISGFSNILGDHFYPVIALFTPLYWLAPSPETLIVAQALLLAASAVPVYLFLKDRLSPPLALTLASAYGVSWGIQQTAAFDVHEMAFAPLAVATLILAMSRRRWPLLWATAAFIVLIKEDLIAFVVGAGLFLAWQGERRRGLALAGAGAVAFVAITGLVIPAFSDTGTYAYANAFAAILERPWTAPLVLATPITKLRTLALWFAPFLFLSLASPFSLLAAPLMLSRLLSASPLHWGTVFHYSAPIAPIIALSAGDGLARLLRRRAIGPRTAGWAAAACLIAAALLPGRPPLARVFSPGHYQPIASRDAAHAALALVPADASVIAQGSIVPHLSQRHDIRVLREGAGEADVVLAAMALNPWPFADAASLARGIEGYRARGYRVAFERDGWIVLFSR